MFISLLKLLAAFGEYANLQIFFSKQDLVRTVKHM